MVKVVVVQGKPVTGVGLRTYRLGLGQMTGFSRKRRVVMQRSVSQSVSAVCSVLFCSVLFYSMFYVITYVLYSSNIRCICDYISLVILYAFLANPV